MAKWTKKEEKELIKHWNDNTVVVVIAHLMGRSVGSITQKALMLRRKGLISGRQKKTGKRIKIPLQKELNPGSYLTKMTYPKYPPYKPTKKTQSQKAIESKMYDITKLLLSKNKAYGDSALAPIRIFSKSDGQEQLKVRIDDKLNRLIQGDSSIESDKDVILDLVGYLVLLLIALDE
jgi:hypothetical protein